MQRILRRQWIHSTLTELTPSLNSALSPALRLRPSPRLGLGLSLSLSLHSGTAQTAAWRPWAAQAAVWRPGAAQTAAGLCGTDRL